MLSLRIYISYCMCIIQLTRNKHCFVSGVQSKQSKGYPSTPILSHFFAQKLISPFQQQLQSGATSISYGIFLPSKQSNLSTFFSLSIGKMQKLEEMQICQRLLQSELVQKRNKLNYMPSLFDRNIIERSASQHFQNPPIFERSKKKGRKQREIRKSRKYTENLRHLQIVASAKREEGKR